MTSKMQNELCTVEFMKKSMEILANNLAKLLRNQGISAHKFATYSRAGSTTISTILNPDREPNYSCTLKKVDDIARYFGLEGWQILIDLSDDELQSVETIKRATRLNKDKPNLALLVQCVEAVNAALQQEDIELQDNKYDLLVEMVYEDAVTRDHVNNNNVASLVRLVAA